MNPFEMISGPALLGQKAAINPFMNLRNMMLLQREDRYDTPRPARMGRQSNSGGFMSGGMSGGGAPDYSAYTFDPQMRAQAQSMGINPLAPNQVNPFAFFPNSGFFGAHPRMTNALEGGLFGAAATQGANTWGEGISNVARGLIEGRQDRSAMYQRQFQIPFENYAQMEKLKGLGIEDTLHEAMIQHLRAQSAALDNKPDPDPHLTSLGHGSFAYFDRNSGSPIVGHDPNYNEKPEKPDQPEQQYYDRLEATLGRPMTPKEQLKAHEDWKKREPNPNAGQGPWGTYTDTKGVKRFMRAEINSPVPGNWQAVTDASKSSEPTQATKTLDDQVKSLESKDSKDQIYSDLLTKKMSEKGNKFSLSDMPTEEDVMNEVRRQQNNLRGQSQATPFPQTQTNNTPPQKPKTIKFVDGGRTYNIPENLLNDFKRDHPNAR